MDISDACSANFVELAPDATVSDVRGEFTQDVETRVVVLMDDTDEFTGVISRKQLLGSKHSPDERAQSVMRHPPRVSRTEDVRETARLMVESGLDLLPVYEGEQFYGVVTARDLLSLVVPHLDALDVEDVYSTDLVTATPETTLGEAIHQIQEYGISHLPIVDGDDPRGMVGVDDLVDFTVRSMNREQGGSLDGFDAHGGDGSADDYRAHGGHGERAGFAARLLDLPVRNVLSTPLHTVSLGTGLDEAVEMMSENEIHSLVVEDDDGRPTGIVTTTDVLLSLTWTEETQMPVQIFGVENMGVLERSDCAARLEEVQGKYAEMDVIEATVVFQQHDENYRGLPLVRTTVRLFTDKGIYSGTNEAYGSEASFDEACEILERNVLEDKRRDQTESTPDLKRTQSDELVEWWAES